MKDKSVSPGWNLLGDKDELVTHSFSKGAAINAEAALGLIIDKHEARDVKAKPSSDLSSKVVNVHAKSRDTSFFRKAVRDHPSTETFTDAHYFLPLMHILWVCVR